MYRTILFPTDGSAGAERALGHALGLAAAEGAELHVLHVVEVVAPAASLHELLVARLTERARDLLAPVVERARERGVAVTTAVREGNPGTAIVDYAEAEDVDLIVMPTHGRTGLERAVLGSVTDEVIRTGTVPVLVVRLDGV